jgi:hypothetical protein
MTDHSGLISENPFAFSCGGGFSTSPGIDPISVAMGITLPGSGLNSITQQNDNCVEPLGHEEANILLRTGLALTVSCASGLSWQPYRASVLKAINDIEKKVGNFRGVFGNLEFRLYPTDPTPPPCASDDPPCEFTAQTKTSRLVEWYNDKFIGSGRGGGTAMQNRAWNIVHELAHVLSNRVGGSMNQDALSGTGNDLLPLARLASTTMQPQSADVNNHVEKVADLFLFWVYDAIDDSTDEGEAALAFADGGIIVRQLGSGHYGFVYVGRNYTNEILDIARNLARSGNSYVFGTTQGFDHWVNMARS